MRDGFYCAGCKVEHPASDFHKSISRAHQYCKKAWDSKEFARALAAKQKAELCA